VASAIGVPVGAQVQVIRCVWTLAGEPAAISLMYLPEPAADAQPAEQEEDEFGAVLQALPGLSARPAAVSVELCPPQPAAARSLRLTPGQPVITVTIRFTDRERNETAGLTVVLLRPELFRVVIDTTELPAQMAVASVWTGTMVPGTLVPRCRPRS